MALTPRSQPFGTPTMAWLVAVAALGHTLASLRAPGPVSTGGLIGRLSTSQEIAESRDTQRASVIEWLRERLNEEGQPEARS
jgi:hypothetical protein